MPPTRPRAQADDTKADSRDRSSATVAGAAGPATGSRPRKAAAVNALAGNAAIKDTASIASSAAPAVRAAAAAAAAAANSAPGQAAGPPGLTWTAEDSTLLHAYRNAYGLPTPPAFHSALSAAVLTAPGIGRHSPTMSRSRDRRKMPKDQLGLAVRKHFNGLAVTETDVVVDFLYAVRNQDRGFKMRFGPKRQQR